MPVVGPALSSAILGQFTARKITGRNAIDLASAVGTAVANYLIIPNLVTCTLAGTVGPIGNINSIVVAGIVPTTMSNFMMVKAASKKLTGRDVSKVFSAISMGLTQVLSTMILTGTAAGIAIGTGTGKFTAVNEQALSKLILAQMTLKKFTGRNARDLADCIAFGVVKQLQTTATFTVMVTGVIAPVPPVGPLPIAGIPSLFTKVS
jgi:hypothetical protein